MIKEKIKIDEYIPIKVTWKELEECPESIIYWRTGDLKKSLLEIGISEASGIIRSLTVISANNIIFSSVIQRPNVRFYKGTPIIDIKNWKGKNKIDDQGMLKIYYDKQFDIVLSNSNISMGIQSGRVWFGLDCNMNVCWISIYNLSKNERVQVKDTIGYMIKNNTKIFTN